MEEINHTPQDPNQPTQKVPVGMEHVSTETHTDTPKTEQPTAFGPIIGVIIIVIVLAFGGLYFWGTTLNNKLDSDQTANDTTLPPQIDITGSAGFNQDAVTKNLSAQGTANDVSSIEADLQATDFGDMESELDALDLEFNL